MNDTFTFYQHLVSLGLGCCSPILNYSTHHFYGASFAHNTSLCLAVDKNNVVFVSNKKKEFGTLLGWGGGGDDDNDSTTI